MENMYLLESGDYLLGIESAAIIRIMDRNSWGETQLNDALLICPASFFNQSDAVLSDSEFSIIEIVNGANALFLLIDRIVGEIEGPQFFESIPRLYPQLASLCCPQIMIHDDKPVLLLDGAGLEAVHRQLGNEYGLISLSALLGKSDVETVVETEPVPPVIEEKIEEPVVALDDVMFEKIVSWTIDEFLGCLDDTPVTVSIEGIPKEYIESMQLQAMDNIVIQEVIDQTVQKCAVFYDASFLRLSDKIAGVKP